MTGVHAIQRTSRRRAGAFDIHVPTAATDAFVTKLDPTGAASSTRPTWAATALTRAIGIAVDAAGNAYVTGRHGLHQLPDDAGRLRYHCQRRLRRLRHQADPPAPPLSTRPTWRQRHDAGHGIAVDTGGQRLRDRRHELNELPDDTGRLRYTFNGASDAFVTKLTRPAPPSSTRPTWAAAATTRAVASPSMPPATPT